MLSTPANRVARTITRSAFAAAMVAPILTFGAQAALAGGDPGPATGNVKTEVVYNCTGGNVTLYPLLTNTGGTQAVQIAVESVDTDELVFQKSLDLSNQFGTAITVPTGHSYDVRVVEINGPGVPAVLSYEQLFVIGNNCSSNHSFTSSATKFCDGPTPTAEVHVTNTGDASDAYTVGATFGGGTAFQTMIVVPSGATKTVTFPMPANITAGFVASNTESDTKDFGPFKPDHCAPAPSGDGSGGGPKDTVPSSTPDANTTGTKATLPPPATVPPTIIPDTIPETTTPVVPTTATLATLPIDIGTPPVFVEELPAIDEIGIPVRVLGEIVTAQPAQAGSDAPLAFTGTASTTLAAAAAALMAAGTAIVLAARRRRQA